MSPTPAPTEGQPRPSSWPARAASVLGRITALALIAGAGVVGWLGVEEFDLGIPSSGNGAPVLAASLPDLGDGLPAARLQSPAPWRQFALTYQDPAYTNRFWIDLDSWQLRIEATQDAGMSAVEINGDRSFTREPAATEWVARDVQETRDIASWLMSGVGPFVLTDLVPPNTLGFTTLELEGTSRDERVYEVSVDSATLLELHPLAHQRWVEATRLVSDTSGVYRIRVREDGYIVRIDGETSSVQWDALEGGVMFLSPFALEAPQTLATAPATTVPGAPVDVPPVPVETPAADN
jgi:hypothetical protein